MRTPAVQGSGERNVAFIKDVALITKDNGIFAFSTLNVDNWWVKLLGKRWPWYMQMHLYYFTIKSIQRLLWRAGFQLIHQEPYRHIVSVKYLMHKIEILLGRNLPISEPLRERLKSRYIPFYFGDITLFIARKIPESL